jgi:hypothetical protein
MFFAPSECEAFAHPPGAASYSYLHRVVIV